MNCKYETKTRLRCNYSYYQILIVEDTSLEALGQFLTRYGILLNAKLDVVE